MKNHPLRVAREAQSLSIELLAEKTQVGASTIRRIEAGGSAGWYTQRQLSGYFGLSPKELGLFRSSKDMPIGPAGEEMVAPPAQNCSLILGNRDMKRREFLHLLSIAGTSLVLPIPDLDWERIDDALTRPSHLDTVAMENLEGINNHLWSLYLAASSKSSVLGGTLEHFKTLVQFLKEPYSTSAHQRLCALASDLSQLAGEIFFDLHEYDATQSCYLFAALAAKEAGSYDLWSCALIRLAFIPIYDEHPRYGDALSLLQGARRLAIRGDSLLPTRYWVAAVEAEAESGVHNLTACQHALDRAHGVLEIKGTSPAWVRFDSSRLPALRGASFVRLNQPDLAMPALQEALQQFVKPGRKRGMALTDLAVASLQRGEVERACSYAHEVVDIVALGASGFLREGVLKVRQQLTPFAKSESVSKLDQHLHSLA